MKKIKKTPNPGSDAAIKLGCTCPAIDNGHGVGRDGLFWFAAGCPVHVHGPGGGK